MAIGAGLPPIIDVQSWDVKDVSELKEQFIGTKAGIEYDDAVRAKLVSRQMADDPTSQSQDSLVSTAGIIARGKLRCTRKLSCSSDICCTLIE